MMTNSQHKNHDGSPFRVGSTQSVVDNAAQTGLGFGAPGRATEVDPWVPDLASAVPADACRFVLPELDLSAAVGAADIKNRVRSPFALILSRAP